jgi:hypothetical protein
MCGFPNNNKIASGNLGISQVLLCQTNSTKAWFQKNTAKLVKRNVFHNMLLLTILKVLKN